MKNRICTCSETTKQISALIDPLRQTDKLQLLQSQSAPMRGHSHERASVLRTLFQPRDQQHRCRNPTVCFLANLGEGGRSGKFGVASGRSFWPLAISGLPMRLHSPVVIVGMHSGSESTNGTNQNLERCAATMEINPPIFALISMRCRPQSNATLPPCTMSPGIWSVRGAAGFGCTVSDRY